MDVQHKDELINEEKTSTDLFPNPNLLPASFQAWHEGWPTITPKSCTANLVTFIGIKIGTNFSP
jgi:hypothetical protein